MNWWYIVISSETFQFIKILHVQTPKEFILDLTWFLRKCDFWKRKKTNKHVFWSGWGDKWDKCPYTLYTLLMLWGQKGSYLISSSWRQLLSEWKTGRELWKLSHFDHPLSTHLGSSQYFNKRPGLRTWNLSPLVMFFYVSYTLVLRVMKYHALSPNN